MSRRPVPDTEFGGRLKGTYYLDLEVAAVADPAPGYRTISFRSPDLVGFEWRPGQDLMLEVPGAPGVRRRYSIRRADAAAGTLDVDVVLHGDGPFARWASAAAPGDRLEGIGPRGLNTVRPDAAHHLIVGDASAAGVSLAMAESLPAGAPATVVLAAPPVPGDAEVTWVAEDELVAHVGALDLPTGTVAYVNGERRLVRDVVAALDLPAEQVLWKAYWRRDQANAPHGEPAKD